MEVSYYSSKHCKYVQCGINFQIKNPLNNTNPQELIEVPQIGGELGDWEKDELVNLHLLNYILFTHTIYSK